MTISLEGKWKNLRNLVSQLESQGWKVVSCEPDDNFTLTTCVMGRNVERNVENG